MAGETIETKRRELAEVMRSATAARQEALSAKEALTTVTDEQQAIELVAKERVQSNRARALGEQAGRLESEIADLERQLAEQRMAALEADAAAALAAAGDAAWQFYDALSAAQAADLTLKAAKSKLSGHPHYGSGLSPEVHTLSGMLARLGFAESYAGAGTGPMLKRKGEPTPAAAKSKPNGVKSAAAALAAAVLGG